MSTQHTPHERAKAALQPLVERGAPVYPHSLSEDLPSGNQPPGLYLGLFHGYVNEEDRANGGDWGVSGPAIGPLRWFHTTYGSHRRFAFVDPERAKVYGLDPEEDHDLTVRDGKAVFGGVEYGDWTVFLHQPVGVPA